jgi:multidrug efflux system membrane fusion protein
VTVGNLVDQNVVLTSVVSSDPIYASFDGDEQTFSRLGGPTRAVNTAVDVGLVGEDGFPHHGKLEFIDNRVDPGTGSVRMRALLDNKDGLLAAGRFARISIGGGDHKQDVVLISDRAVGTDQDRKFVYVVSGTDNNFKADYRSVKLGPIVDGMRVVRSGLKPGEQIVVNGLQRVRPGAPVAPSVVPMEASLRNVKDGAPKEGDAATAVALSK